MLPAGTRSTREIAPILRQFEVALLQELGYALLLQHEAGSNQPIDAAVNYRYVIERGAMRDGENAIEGMPIVGKTLLDMAADDYRDAVSAQQSKQLMRVLLNHYLAGKILHTRELIKDLQKL